MVVPDNIFDQFHAINLEYFNIEIFSMTGQKVYDKLSTGEKVTLDVSEYKPDVYFLRIYSKDGFDLKKVVVN